MKTTAKERQRMREELRRWPTAPDEVLALLDDLDEALAASTHRGEALERVAEAVGYPRDAHYADVLGRIDDLVGVGSGAARRPRAAGRWGVKLRVRTWHIARRRESVCRQVAVETSPQGEGCMTPDYRIHLRPGVDLITAEDVLAWLETPLIPRIEAERSLARQRWCSNWDVLRARLDRERRQACRRAALRRWRDAARYIRFARSYQGRRWAWPEYVQPGDGDAEAWAWRDVAVDLARCLTDALAFRAAARAK